MRRARNGELDEIIVPPQPLDVLSQQVVAEVAAQEWDEGELYAAVWPSLAVSKPAAQDV